MIIKIIIKSEIIVTTQENARGAAHSICNLRYKTTEQIPIVLHNGSTYDYHFIWLSFDIQRIIVRVNLNA